jgi:hypothetical protein
MEPRTMTVRICEEQKNWIVRDSIEIEFSEYPELKDLSDEDAQKYIEDNRWDMKAPSSCDWADSLGDALEQQDIVREKDTGTETFIEFD